MIIPVILSGGSGTRLWPLSRALYPKQLLSLVGEGTMLQETVARLQGIADAGPMYCVCNEEHRFLVAEQLRQVNAHVGGIILEPVGRNTAPAAAAAAIQIQKEHPGAIMLMLPADHVISNPEAFVRAVGAGVDAARSGALVTFGVIPDSPETGYGYIKADGDGDVPVRHGEPRRVLEFREKPDRETAEEYVSSGDYLWNSGIFLLGADQYLKELARHDPEIGVAVEAAVEGASRDLDFLRLDEEAFTACPSNSIDYAVMEKTEKAMVVPFDAGWNDVGAWSALWGVSPRDEVGNVKKGDVLAFDVHDSYLHASSRLVAAVGLDDCVVVETADAVLVAAKDRVQDVKVIVEQLKAAGRPETVLHQRVFRPWGSYETIEEAERYKVKRIVVNPGAALSLQKHYHRAEHWIVVRGSALIQNGDNEILLSEDQSTYIPHGTLHRLENPGKIPLELIEVQTGSYLGEDDIVRYEDRYGR